MFRGGGAALLIASLFCIFYHNPGIHITNKSGVTDYHWLGTSFSSTMVEGFACNNIDKNGYYNLDSDIDKGMDILVMGSSHMEGSHVFHSENVPFLLSKLTSLTTYNIGISSHGLLNIFQNLEVALLEMQPKKYVVFETMTNGFPDSSLIRCFENKLPEIKSHDTGILFHLQKVPFFKLLWYQLRNWQSGKVTKKSSINKESYNSAITLMPLLQKVRQICKKHNIQPIIFYHPKLELCPNGNAKVITNKEALERFKNACLVNEVIFIDMSEDFMGMYKREKVLPHGFCNTRVGVGHMNRYGMKCVANKLAQTIKELEAQP